MNARMLSLASCLVLSSWSLAQEKPDAKPQPKDDRPSAQEPQPDAAPAPSDPGRELFEKAAQTLQKAKSITYRVHSSGTGSFDTFTAKVDAEVKMIRSEAQLGVGGWIVRVTGLADSRQDHNLAIDALWMDRSVEWLDPATNKLVERPVRDAKGSVVSTASGTNIRIEELTQFKPFEKILRSDEFIMEGQSEVNGVLCDQLETIVHLNGRDSRTRWALGAEDHLPRRIERIVESTAMKGSMIAEISGVQVAFDAPAFTPESLRIKLPGGYTEDRVVPPAPARLNPASRPDYDGPLGPGAGGATKGAETGPGAQPQQPAAVTLPQLPAFTAKAADGTEVSNASIAGHVAVFTYFGSWSPQCKEWHGTLKGVTDKFGDQVQVYALAVRDRSAEAAQRALERAGVSFTLVPQGDAAAEAMHVKVYPTTIVVGKTGEVYTTQESPRGEESAHTVEQAIRDAIAGNQPHAVEKPEIQKEVEKGAAQKSVPSKEAPVKGSPAKVVPAKALPGKGEPAKSVPPKGGAGKEVSPKTPAPKK